MYKEYVVVGDDAYVTNEFGQMKKYTTNIINTLENENSIEYLNDLITSYQNEINFFNKEYKIKQKNSIKLFVFIFVIATVLEILIEQPLSLFIPASLIGSGIIITSIANAVDAKKNNEVLSFKLKHVKEEKRKLERKQNSKSEELILEDGVIKKINNSDQINSLKRELELIEQYKSNKSKYITYYKNNCLNIYMGYLGYHGESIDFVVSLIEQDLGIKHKQKLLSNK